MLSSINFLFLLSLGFVSWTILCYIRQIEEFVDINSNTAQEIYRKDIPIMAVPTNADIIAPSTSNRENYDLYVNFFYFLVCMYALTKVTHLAETYMAKHIRHRIYMPTAHDVGMEGSEHQEENFKWKIKKLEKQNHDMKFKLESVVDFHTPTQTNLEDQIRHIFITNKHVHLNRQIYVNQGGNFNMDFEEEQRQSPNIWEKYMELRNSTSHTSNGKISTSQPVVMSSAELESITSK